MVGFEVAVVFLGCCVVERCGLLDFLGCVRRELGMFV